MPKSEVYSWRLSPDLKHRLEARALAERTSLARLVERIVRDWLKGDGSGDDENAHSRARKAAASCFGSIAGPDPERSRRVREGLRTKLERTRRGRRS